MHKFYGTLFLTLACLGASLPSLSAVSVRTPVIDVDAGVDGYYDDPYYHVWVGPGWYYGRYYSSEDEYYYWLDNGFYAVRWEGPGWYYGIYLNNRSDFDRYRRSHRAYRNRYGYRGYSQRGKRSLHQTERRGRWSRGSKR